MWIHSLLPLEPTNCSNFDMFSDPHSPLSTRTESRAAWPLQRIGFVLWVWGLRFRWIMAFKTLNPIMRIHLTGVERGGGSDFTGGVLR